MADSENKARSLEEIKQLRKAKIESLLKENRKVSGLNKLALWITVNVGSMKFFLIIFGWTILWLFWNMLAPKHLRFDPFPAFVLWLFISNMIQLFLMPLIMIGQNLLSAQSDARAAADFEINKQAEQEIETVLQHLEYQNTIMLDILDKINEKSNKS